MQDKNKISKDVQNLSRRAVDLYSIEELELKIGKGRPLRIKYGADPSAPDIHLGHVVGLNKLREFQDLGHTVVFIIGDFTGMIGDPSGRSKIRPKLSREQVEQNAKTYQKQVFKILDREKTEVYFNSEWFAGMTLDTLSHIAARVTVAQMLQRDDFAKRYADNAPISLVEFLYPLIQAFDSVKIEADVELGGTDQLFNFLLGREMQKSFDQVPQVVMTLPLLVGLDGVKKMSKSLDNYVGITDAPKDMFGKLMSVSDELMWRYFELVLCYSCEAIEALKNSVENPRFIKERMAREIITRFYDASAATSAAEEFSRVFTEKKVPSEIPEVVIPMEMLEDGKMGLLTLLVKAGMASSNSEARRLVQSGAVSVGDDKITDPKLYLELSDGTIVKAGKRKFARIKTQPSHNIEILPENSLKP